METTTADTAGTATAREGAHPDSTHTVRADRLAWLGESIAKLGRRAARLGLPIPTVEVLSERTRIVRDEDTGIKRHVPIVDVRLAGGGEVKLAGWALVAALELDEAGINVRTVPGETCPPELRGAPMTRCDHCNAARQRTAVFVVRHDAGEHKVIGRTCLADFLGGNDPERLLCGADYALACADLLDGEESDGYGAGGRAAPVALDEFLAVVCRVAREYGFVSRKLAETSDKTSTATWINLRVWGRKTQGTADLFALKIEEQDRTRAGEIIAWAGAELVRDTDYEHNLRQVLSAEIVPMRRCGLATSLYAVHSRAVEERAKREARKPSAHVGAIGKRATFTVTVDATHVIEGFYGATTIVRMRDSEDNVIVWFASNPGDLAERGWTGKVKATPKRHDERKGELQTIVSRVTPC